MISPEVVKVLEMFLTVIAIIAFGLSLAALVPVLIAFVVPAGLIVIGSLAIIKFYYKKYLKS